MMIGVLCMCFFFKQKPAYEMRISDWSSDVCSSDLGDRIAQDRERLRLDDVGNGRRRHLHTLEIGRVGDIGGAGAPLIGFRAGDIDAAPPLVEIGRES